MLVFLDGSTGGEKATSVALERCRELLYKGLLEEDDAPRASAAPAVGYLSRYLSAAEVTDLMLDLAGGSYSSSTSGGDSSCAALCGRIAGLGHVLQYGGDKTVEVRDDASKLFRVGAEDDKAAVRIAVCR